MTPTGVIFIILALISVAVFVDEELRIARYRREARAIEAAAAERELIRAAFETDYNTPDHEIVAWTPEEREAFGHNETLRFISETDQILNAFEWEKIKADANQRVIHDGEWTTTADSAKVIASGTIIAGGVRIDSKGIRLDR